MRIDCVWEHNGSDTLLYAASLPGAYTRGNSPAVALSNMEAEARSWLRWAGMEVPEKVYIEIRQDAACELCVRDADSDVLFETEKAPLTPEEYETLKALALKSAEDFLAFYEAFPEKDRAASPVRQTFYGAVPRTAREMYEHTKSVNAYYFTEIDVAADNDGSILDCRRRGFAALEAMPGYLENCVLEGSYGEFWSLRKLLRRFIWHDRIHAKAMYRLALHLYGEGTVPNVYGFEIG